MTYLQHKDLKPEEFNRLCGVHTKTFVRMVSVVQEQVEQKKKKLGKPSKLSVEEQVRRELGVRSASTVHTSPCNAHERLPPVKQRRTHRSVVGRT